MFEEFAFETIISMFAAVGAVVCGWTLIDFLLRPLRKGTRRLACFVVFTDGAADPESLVGNALAAREASDPDARMIIAAGDGGGVQLIRKMTAGVPDVEVCADSQLVGLLRGVKINVGMG